jgi:hypothetical protein
MSFRLVKRRLWQLCGRAAAPDMNGRICPEAEWRVSGAQRDKADAADGHGFDSY